MRRFAFAIVLASVLSLIALVPSSFGAPPSFGAALRVTGNGTITGCISPGPCDRPDATFSVSAQSFPTDTGGQVGQGTYTFGTSIAADVQCVSSTPNFVAVGGTITAPDPIVGQHFVVYLQETVVNHQTIASQISRPDIDPENSAGEQLPPDFPNTCPTTVGAVTYYSLLSGRVNVDTFLFPLVKKFH